VVADKSLYVVVVEKKSHLRSRFSPRCPGSTLKAFCELQNVSTFPSFLKEFHAVGVNTRRLVKIGGLSEICIVDAFLKTVK